MTEAHAQQQQPQADLTLCHCSCIVYAFTFSYSPPTKKVQQQKILSSLRRRELLPGELLNITKY